MDLFDPADPRPVHFMGIGGAGMSALALVARRRGVAVTGCDPDPSGAADVAALGAQVYHRARSGSRRGRPRRRGDRRGSARIIPNSHAPARWAFRSSRARRRWRSWCVPAHGGGDRRYPRQDHHDGDDHRGADRGGTRAHRARRRTGERLGRQRPAGRRPALRGRGRRVRPGVSHAPADGRGGEQRRGRSSRVLRHRSRRSRRRS